MYIVVGYPTVAHVDALVLPHFARAIAESCRLGKVGVSVSRGLLPYDKARQKCLDDALSLDADYFLSLDSDMTFPEGFVQTLFDALKSKRDEGFVCVSGYYRRRGYPFTGVWSVKEGDKFYHREPGKGSKATFEIHMTGLGCCLIDLKWVKEHMSEPHFRYYEHEDGHYVLDDESFFEQLRDKGGRILGHAGVRCGHYMDPIEVNEETYEALLLHRVQAILTDGVA